MSEQGDSHSCTQIDDLNDDCMLMIFSFLSMEQKIQIERVCKRWRDLSLASWKDVKVFDTWHWFQNRWSPQPAAPDILKALNRITAATTDLIFYNVSIEEFSTIVGARRLPNIVSFTAVELPSGILTHAVIQLMIQNLPNLKRLRLEGYPRGIADDHSLVGELLDALPSIEDITFANSRIDGRFLSQCSNQIKKLNISGCGLKIPKTTENHFTQAFARLDGVLEELVIDLVTLENIKARISSPGSEPLKCCSLRILYVEQEYEDEDIFENIERELFMDFKGLPNLEELQTDRGAYFMCNSANIVNLNKNCPKIRRLSLPDCQDMPYHDNTYDIRGSTLKPAMRVLSDMTDVEELDLSYLNIMYADELDQVTKLKRLKKLHIRGIGGSITQANLVHLINETASLTFLDCSGTRAAEESENVEIEKFCKQLISDVSRPQLEIVLGGCCFELKADKSRWLHGRFIINQAYTSRRFEPEDDVCDDDPLHFARLLDRVDDADDDIDLGWYPDDDFDDDLDRFDSPDEDSDDEIPHLR